MTNLFECESVEDIVIAEWGSNFFKPNDGTTKIRFLMWPIKYYIAQAWSDDRKPIWNKKFYAHEDKEALKDSDSKLILTYLIYDYTDKQVKQWDIQVKSLLKTIKNLNSLNPDLAAMDCNLTKGKGSNGFNEYSLINWAPTPFTNEDVIKQFTEDNPFLKTIEAIDKKIEETKNGLIEDLPWDNMIAEAEKAFA